MKKKKKASIAELLINRSEIEKEEHIRNLAIKHKTTPYFIRWAMNEKVSVCRVPLFKFW